MRTPKRLGCAYTRSGKGAGVCRREAQIERKARRVGPPVRAGAVQRVRVDGQHVAGLSRAACAASASLARR